MRQLLLIAFLLVIQGFSAQIIILIDPGHGGSDPGHESLNQNHLPEKDLNLILAKKFGSYLTEKLSNVTVLYTRTDDSFPSLDERVNMANDRKVDYFISIHCNGSPNKKIHGTESHVHTLGSRKSVKLARSFEKEFETKAGRKSRGVKDNEDREHTLWVLKFTEMTSVLVECGFLTNSTEANYLNTSYGQEILASALFRGMRDYLIAAHPRIEFVKEEAPEPEKKEAEKKEIAENGSTKYTIQLMSSKSAISTNDAAFKVSELPVEREEISPTGYRYRYVVGDFSDVASAKALRDKLRKKGFPDAMVIRKK